MGRGASVGLVCAAMLFACGPDEEAGGAKANPTDAGATDASVAGSGGASAGGGSGGAAARGGGAAFGGSGGLSGSGGAGAGGGGSGGTAGNGTGGTGASAGGGGRGVGGADASAGGGGSAGGAGGADASAGGGGNAGGAGGAGASAGGGGSGAGGTSGSGGFGGTAGAGMGGSSGSGGGSSGSSGAGGFGGTGTGGSGGSGGGSAGQDGGTLAYDNCGFAEDGPWIEIEYWQLGSVSSPSWTLSSTPGWGWSEWAWGSATGPEIFEFGGNSMSNDPIGVVAAISGTWQMMIGLTSLVSYDHATVCIEGRSISVSSDAIMDVTNPLNGCGVTDVRISNTWQVHAVGVDLGSCLLPGEGTQAVRIEPWGGSGTVGLKRVRVTLHGAVY